LTGTVHTSGSPVDHDLAGARVMVTGAAGFLGAHVVRRLLGIGCQVKGVIRPGSEPWRLDRSTPGLELVTADVRQLDEAVARRGLSDVHAVFHLAAAGVDPSRSDAEEITATNVLGTLQALRAASRVGARRFVYCGSCFEYGAGTGLHESALPEPAAEYGASKAAGWLLAHAYGRREGLAVVALRPFTLYGPLEAAYRLVPHSIRACLTGERLTLTEGRQTRDFVYVDDAVEAFLMAAVAPDATGGTFNVCTGVETSVREVVSAIVQLTGGTVRPEFGAVPHRATELWRQSGDPTRAAVALGWCATTPLQEGLARTLEWFRTNGTWNPEHQSVQA
jgi:nucleoside-diphosphate-sugar epimerase